jgi:hypothetical protein
MVKKQKSFVSERYYFIKEYFYIYVRKFYYTLGIRPQYPFRDARVSQFSELPQ